MKSLELMRAGIQEAYDIGSKGINKFNDACRYMRHSNDFFPSLTRKIYNVATFAIDLPLDLALTGVGLVSDIAGYFMSDSVEDWQIKKRESIEFLTDNINSAIKTLNDYNINTEFVGNLIDIVGSIVPSIRAIGKTARELWQANRIQKKAFEAATERISELNRKLEKRSFNIEKEMERNIHEIMESNAKEAARAARKKNAANKRDRKTKKAQNEYNRNLRNVKHDLYRKNWNCFWDFFKDQCMVRYDDWKARMRELYSFVGTFLADQTEEELEEEEKDDEEVDKIMDEVKKKSDKQMKNLLQDYADELREKGQNKYADIIEEIINPNKPKINLKGCVGCFYGDNGTCIPFDFT